VEADSMKKALLVIDYTNDFVADNGALTCGKAAQDIEDNIVAKIKEYAESNNPIFVINDIHYINETGHPESRLFPPHNIANTGGRDVYGKVGEVLNEYAHKVHVFDKTRYSAFTSPDFTSSLSSEIVELELCGVCTDICILHTAVDAYNKGYNVIVDSTCVASFNEAGHEWALNHFRNVLGFNVF
jgi:nicotinamidase-related amidase